MKVLVIGAGVMGLSSAVCIQQCFPHSRVTVMSELWPPEDIVSMVAGGIALLGKESELGQDISKSQLRKLLSDSLNHYKMLAADGNNLVHGVNERNGYSLHGTKTYGEKLKDDVRPMVTEFFPSRHCEADELRKLIPQYTVSGWYFRTIIIDTRRYLSYLLNQFTSAGGKSIRRKINHLQEVIGDYDVVVNCAGLGNETLMQDESMRPVKGQMVRLSTQGSVDEFFYLSQIKDPQTDQYIMRYILPQPYDVVVGGTHEENSRTKDMDPDVVRSLVSFAQQRHSHLATSEVISAYSGLRPLRIAGLRIEEETTLQSDGSTQVIHNYGHGGRGVGLSWGSAVKVVQLIKNRHNLPKSKL